MTETIIVPEVEQEQQTKRQPPYHVILLNDDDHTFEYVIRMLKELFGYQEEKGFLMAYEVHTKGRVIVCTTSLERAAGVPERSEAPLAHDSPGVEAELFLPRLV